MRREDIAHWRLRNLRLSGDPLDTPEDVVRWLGVVQSQDYAPAKWSIAERATGVSDAALDRAYAAGSILRTHILRPTWHFVLPDDIRWMQELTAPRVHALNAYYYRQLGLDDSVLGKTAVLLRDALRGGDRLTRKELAAILEGAGIATAGFRMAYILMHAELNGLICSGGLSGKQHTYALLDERAPAAAQLTRDEALAELTLRYFTSHGPATVKDFRWWSSLNVADINEGLAMVGSRLDHETVDGVEYWFASSGPAAVRGPTPKAASPAAHLLQAYDEYFVGYGPGKEVIDLSGVVAALPDGAIPFNHVVVLDSQVVGCWKRTLKRGSVDIQAAMYTPLDPAQEQAIRAAADKHGAFLGLTAGVVIATC
jgi:Winged helix DNA-binding domain